MVYVETLYGGRSVTASKTGTELEWYILFQSQVSVVCNKEMTIADFDHREWSGTGFVVNSYYQF